MVQTGQPSRFKCTVSVDTSLGNSNGCLSQAKRDWGCSSEVEGLPKTDKERFSYLDFQDSPDPVQPTAQTYKTDKSPASEDPSIEDLRSRKISKV